MRKHRKNPKEIPLESKKEITLESKIRLLLGNNWEIRELGKNSGLFIATHVVKVDLEKLEMLKSILNCYSVSLTLFNGQLIMECL